MPSKLSFNFNKYKLFLLPAIILLLVCVSGLFLLKPKINQVLSIRQNLSSQKNKLAQLTTKVTALQGLDEVELEERTKVLLGALPSQKDLPGALMTIKSLTTTTGLELRGIQVEPGEISTESAQPETTQKYNLPFLEFKIRVGGNQTQLKDFLTKLVLTAPLMRVAAMEISQAEGEAIEADLKLDTFFLPLPSTLGTAEKPLAAITPQEEVIYQQLTKISPGQTGTFSPIPSGKENPFTP
jgi:Tfp pilus assembly protein PilO